MDLNKGSPPESEPSSGFTFNFPIPTLVKQTSDPDPSAGKTVMSEGKQSSESTADSKPKPKKKKKKKKKAGAGGGEESVAENENKMREETPEQQLNQELDWCIEQLDSKAPIVKKRQVMRAVSGDYRKKMEEDRERQYKLIHSAMSSAKVRRVSESRCTATYHRRTETRRPSANEASLPAERTDEAEDRFVFRASGEEMSELSDEASESEQLGSSLSVWLADSGSGQEELDVPLDLHTACSIGQYDVVAECIRKGKVDVDGRNLGGWTPLMYAAYIGHDNVVNLLLESGVSVNASTAKGLTPLMLAASCGNESIAYFLLQQGAELERKDERGWTALLHSTSTGHQQMVQFLLDNNANANIKEPVFGFSPLMEAAASGHEIIVQNLLDRGARVEERNLKGVYEELSSSEEDSATPRARSSRSRARGPSIHDGPQAIARFRVTPKHEPALTPPGYMSFGDEGEPNEGICNRDVTSPINELDGQSNSSRDELFFDNEMPTIRSSSSSSEGLPRLLGLSREASLESNEDSDQAKRSCPRRPNKPHHSKGKSRHGNSDCAGNDGTPALSKPPPYKGPRDLEEFLEQIGFGKYLPLLEEQDIDLRIFLTLTENDLKEVGITLFGPKRKMTSAIARWHSKARPPSDALEQAYADKLEAEMQEMAIQLHKRCVEVESLQGQVSQEKELRTVMEGCLMEEKMAWRGVQAELRESVEQIKAMNSMLHQLRNTHTQLAQAVEKDVGSVYSEMLAKMESCEEKLGINL
ncbi:Ankyrin repeat and SAM domain-containing protein 3 [Bagarius yarrelli]|uniref:Ankyrin repeat and SAM domain-containing protein 3 n=1 Tax=Bagarius yarrelli TaxID=175774 RepID=A0A556U1C9_BAGYA|nr:Ankyrin repeat and SAM domain-containing protein 3 [Bagarius yarrelli]